MILSFIPLQTVGRVLVPIGSRIRVESDHLHISRAITEECRERGWEVMRQSATLAQCVAADRAPWSVVKTGGGVMLAVWVGQ